MLLFFYDFFALSFLDLREFSFRVLGSGLLVLSAAGDVVWLCAELLLVKSLLLKAD